MNWNGQRRYLDHSIRIRTEPERAAQLQAEMNSYRRSRISDSLTSRPVFLPLTFNMAAAAQTSAYRDMTPSLQYDILITGIKSDTQMRSILIKQSENDKSFVRVGDESNLYLRTDDIAGQGATNGGGQLGVFYLPTPIPLKSGNRLTVEMFKTDDTAEEEQANIVFVGIRVFNRAYGGLLVDADEQQLIDQYIAMREIPANIWLKQLVEFDKAEAGGEARNLYTPKVEEPLLIIGMRTTLRQSLIEMGIQGEPTWTLEPTPIWAIAAEDDLYHENYQWFSKPIFLHSKETIEIRRVVNSIDGSLLDAQMGNTITWICKTV